MAKVMSGASDVSETNSSLPTVSRRPVKPRRPAFCSVATGTRASVPAHDDERLAGGNPVDDQLEDGALILRDGQPGEQQECEQAEGRESGARVRWRESPLPVDQRGHAPFGV